MQSEAKVTVTQADRDAAAAYMRLVRSTRWSIEGILNGGCDNTRVVKAFARHRILVAAEQRGREQERARVVEWLRDAAVRPYCEQADESEFAFCASAIERGDHLPREAVGGDNGHD